MSSTLIIKLQEYTSLPLKVVDIADRRLPDVIVSTPHRGDVDVALKEEHYPFLFGSVSQTERHAYEVIAELRELERDAKDFLLAKWLKSRK